jgi:hypothetical protein
MENGMSNEVIEMASQSVVATPSSAVTPGDLLRYALESGADLDRLEKLMDLQQRHEANEARKAFADDMARFKANPPEIFKDKHVSFKTDKGRTEYDHATIGNVTQSIVAALAQHGFSHRWDLEQKDGQVIVECVITHRMGHSQSTRLQASPDASGGKNGIQSIVSAKTYLERHTLLAATGLATKDQVDDDGAGSLDTTLADNWIAKVKAAPTDAEVVNVWNVGVAVIEKAGDKHAYTEFKDAVAARRAELAKGAEK